MRFYTHTGILFSHKKKEILPFVATWMDLEGIMLSEIHQTEKEIQGDLIYMWNLKYSIKTSLIDTKNILVIARSGGGVVKGWEKCMKVIKRYSHKISHGDLIII